MSLSLSLCLSSPLHMALNLLLLSLLPDSLSNPRLSLSHCTHPLFLFLRHLPSTRLQMGACERASEWWWSACRKRAIITHTHTRSLAPPEAMESSERDMLSRRGKTSALSSSSPSLSSSSSLRKGCCLAARASLAASHCRVVASRVISARLLREGGARASE